MSNTMHIIQNDQNKIYLTYLSITIDNVSASFPCSSIAMFLHPSQVMNLLPSETTWTIWEIFFINNDILTRLRKKEKIFQKIGK